MHFTIIKSFIVNVLVPFVYVVRLIIIIIITYNNYEIINVSVVWQTVCVVFISQYLCLCM